MRRTIHDYQSITLATEIDDLKDEARALRGQHILHVNTSAKSGGVAEMLKSQVPLERSLGMHSEWFVMRGDNSFFEVTKKMHNLLQGKKGTLTDTERALYLYHAHRVSAELLESLTPDTLLIIHDPQPLPLVLYLPATLPVIVRLHPDLSQPDTEVMRFLEPLIRRAHLTIVSDRTYRPAMLPREKTLVSFPAIDPLNPKNDALPADRAERILEKIGLDTSRPIVTQISRFDPWKDPVGVVQAFRIAQHTIPGLQLVLGGLIVAEDDPEAHRLYAETREAAANDPDIHLFAGTKPPGGISNDLFINALQSASTVILQKSTREGFGMTVTESMWKGAAVIAGDATGLRRQIQDGINGYIVSSIDACAQRIVELAQDSALRTRIGNAARESVRERYLMPRLIRDHLEAYRSVLPQKPTQRFPHLVPSLSTH